jgi:hypothetical protein
MHQLFLQVKLWDLRKLTNLHTLALPEGKGGMSVKFDLSGSFLGVGCVSGHVVVQGVKEWTTVNTLKGERETNTNSLTTTTAAFKKHGGALKGRCFFE